MYAHQYVFHNCHFFRVVAQANLNDGNRFVLFAERSPSFQKSQMLSNPSFDIGSAAHIHHLVAVFITFASEDVANMLPFQIMTEIQIRSVHSLLYYTNIFSGSVSERNRSPHFAIMPYVRHPRERKPPAPRNDELQPPRVGSKWCFCKKGFKKGGDQMKFECTAIEDDKYTLTAPGGVVLQWTKEKFTKQRKKDRMKMDRGGAHPKTLKWREILKRKAKSPPRDLSPMPEHIETAYTRPRFEAERLAEKEKLSQQRAAKRAAEGKPPARKNAECRMSKTTYPMNAGHINKLFFERDILVDKLKRRNDQIKLLREKVLELGGAPAADPPSDSDSDSSSSSSTSAAVPPPPEDILIGEHAGSVDSPSGSNVVVLPSTALNG